MGAPSVSVSCCGTCEPACFSGVMEMDIADVSTQVSWRFFFSLVSDVIDEVALVSAPSVSAKGVRLVIRTV